MGKEEKIKTRIWSEVADESNPFAATASYCSGYDVYGDLLGNISWIEYLYLMFKLELPSAEHARLLEMVAVAIAHPGIRDHSVRAAMSAGTCGSTRASSLMAALAVGAGNLGGGREVYEMVGLWLSIGADLKDWLDRVSAIGKDGRIDVWLPLEHVPGFDPNGRNCPKQVVQALTKLSESGEGGYLGWLNAHREQLESAVGYPLAMSGVVATALADMSFTPAQAEMLFLLLRLPGAAAHSLEQEALGWRQYPFFKDGLIDMDSASYRETLAGNQGE